MSHIASSWYLGLSFRCDVDFHHQIGGASLGRPGGIDMAFTFGEASGGSLVIGAQCFPVDSQSRPRDCNSVQPGRKETRD